MFRSLNNTKINTLFIENLIIDYLAREECGY